MSIVLSIIVFSVLVLIHEFGHFLLAKKNGIGVTEFSLGMGPRIASFDKGGTKYSWKLIPFGGSCMMVGEDEESGAENSFGSKTVWARIAVVVAGPMFNFLLAFVISIVYISLEGYDAPNVVSVEENSIVSEAGIEKGDAITEYDGETIVLWRDLWLYQYLNKLDGSPVKVKYERNGKEYTTSIIPEKYYSLGISYVAGDDPCKIEVSEKTAVYEAGVRSGDTIIGIDGNELKSGKELHRYITEHPLTDQELTMTVLRDEKELDFTVTPKLAGYTDRLDVGERVKANPWQVIRYSFTELRYDMDATISGFKMIFTGKASRDDVSGPVGIVKIVGDSYEESKDYGYYYVFLDIAYLTMVISVNLGVVNLLPIPALDGGRLVFLIIEAVRGKPVPREKEAMVHFAGMVLLMILMVAILANDITKFF
ncbi:MAG: RIP metalloprotease RseP [Lachnospiraceae bacterium]|nr:RIP metalloprotease RseP [Lachnospiraceae bacterium]